MQSSQKTPQKWGTWWCAGPRALLPSLTISKQPLAFQNTSDPPPALYHWGVNCSTPLTSDSEMDSNPLQSSSYTSFLFGSGILLSAPFNSGWNCLLMLAIQCPQWKPHKLPFIASQNSFPHPNFSGYIWLVGDVCVWKGMRSVVDSLNLSVCYTLWVSMCMRGNARLNTFQLSVTFTSVWRKLAVKN